MSIYWNEKTKQLKPYVAGEQPRDRKFIKLNTNENPYPPSPLVIEAIQKAATETLKLYPDPACTILREAAAARYGIKAEQVFAGNGSDEILAFAFAAFFETAQYGNPILFPDITYSFYPVYADLWNITYGTVPLGKDFSIDTKPYIDLLSGGKSSGVIISNPNAPTGIALSQEDLKKIADAAEKNKRVLVVDEAYIAFADGEGIGSMLPFLNEHPNLLIIRTFSKEASLAGLRAGLAFGSEELVEGLCRIRDSFNSYTLDRLALAGAAAALNDPSYYKEINTRIITTRNRVSAGLESLGFIVLPSQANFIFSAPPSESGISGGEFFSALRERGILVRHFDKPRIADYMRISIGNDEDMDTFLEKCEAIMKREKGKMKNE